MTENKVIDLSNAILIGEGDHKRTFVDPTDPGRCIKVLFTYPDVDMERELKYRRSREKRGLKSQLLPAYYGTVETNLGKGYVFERVADFDGSSSKTFQQVFGEAAADPGLLPLVEEAMVRFKELLFRELIIISNTQAANFVLQRTSETRFTIRIIDNLGSPVFLPLAYYFDSVARKRLTKYWKRFLHELGEKFPTVMTEELKNRLL